MDKVAVGPAFLQVLWLSPVSVFLLVLHTNVHLNAGVCHKDK